jgi:hypothetical protein
VKDHSRKSSASKANGGLTGRGWAHRRCDSIYGCRWTGNGGCWTLSSRGGYNKCNDHPVFTVTADITGKRLGANVRLSEGVACRRGISNQNSVCLCTVAAWVDIHCERDDRKNTLESNFTYKGSSELSFFVDVVTDIHSTQPSAYSSIISILTIMTRKGKDHCISHIRPPTGK